MKTPKAIFALLLFITGSIKAQDAYYDAITLKQKLDQNQQTLKDGQIPLDNQIREMLKHYYGVAVPTSNDKQTTIDSFFVTNPYFRRTFSTTQALFSGQGPQDLPAYSTALSSIGGLNVTNFADGLAKFLVKRFKEELSVSFFQKFKDELSKSAELQTLFPQTYTVLQAIDKDIYRFNLYVSTLREAFSRDLVNLYINFNKAKELPSIKSYLTGHPYINTIIFNSLYFIDAYRNKVHPGQALEDYKPDEMLTFPDTALLQLNTRSAIKTLQLFSGSFRSQSAEHFWVPADSVKTFLEDSITRTLYLGLLWAQSDAIQFNVNGTRRSFRYLLGSMYNVNNQITEVQSYLNSLITSADAVNENLILLKNKDSVIDYKNYYNLFNASLDLLDQGVKVVNLSMFTIRPTLKDSILKVGDRWLRFARSTGDLYVDVRAKNYSSAVMNTNRLLNIIYEENPDQIKPVSDFVLKYGTFAANVVQAKNSDEVEEAIEAVVLPVGSASIKRETTRNIALNAYVGGFAGAEYMPSLTTDKTAFSAGITAPVGVAFSWGKRGGFPFSKKSNANKAGKSHTIFISLIDVGALAAYRINDDKTEISSDIQLKNIVAPGLYYYLGLGKCPLSIGAGAQLGPQLHNVANGVPAIDTKNIYIRYGISIAVDIPLLNFHTKD